MAVYTCNASAKEAESGGLLQLFEGSPRFLGVQEVSERLCHQNKVYSTLGGTAETAGLTHMQ